MIVDDAESMLEPETLIIVAHMKPKQLILIGSEDLPRPLVHSHDLSKSSHFNKSLIVRMLEREWPAIEVKN